MVERGSYAAGAAVENGKRPVNDCNTMRTSFLCSRCLGSGSFSVLGRFLICRVMFKRFETKDRHSANLAPDRWSTVSTTARQLSIEVG